jgi:hypothetical protein
LQGALPDAEIVLDRGQGDVHDRNVEHDHELRRARQDEDHFLVCVRLDSHCGFPLRLDGCALVAVTLRTGEARRVTGGDPKEALAGRRRRSAS